MSRESRRAAPAALRWTVYVAVAIVFAIACAFLSNWQFSRNAERSRQLTLVSENYDATPVALDDLLPAGGGLDPGDEWRPVTLTGSYLDEDQLLVRNRAHGGTAAYEIVVPFRLDDGRVLLIDRGWEPPGNHQSLPDDVPAPPAGEVTVIARLKPGEALPSSGAAAPDGQVPSIHLPTVADATGDGSLETGAYGILDSETPAPADLPEPIETPSADPGPYLSYAIQWILFAIMGFVFIWYAIRSERRARAEEAEDARAAADAAAAGLPTPAPAPKERRRKDRDMADEDALLDRSR